MNFSLKGGLLAVLAAVAILFFFLDPSEHDIFPRCIFYSVTGYYCPGCGSQRSIHSLLHFDFKGVVQHNVLFLMAVPALLYHYLHPFFNKKFYKNLPNLFYMKATPVVVLILIILFWFIRNLPFFPFSGLAPGQ
jgi:hypothetical protein